MNSVINILETNDRKVYFTSDTHFNHDRDFVYAARGYSDSQSHTSAVINKINEIVRPNDILFHLGDFSLNTDESGFNEVLSRIMCQNIYTLWGNHNSPSWNVYRNELTRINQITDVRHYASDWDLEIYPLKYRNMVFLGNYAETVVNGHRFILSHYPLKVWNKQNKGSKMIHGHCHGNLKTSLPEETKSGKILDVSWDVFKKPISLPEILKIVNEKEIIKVDHH